MHPPGGVDVKERFFNVLFILVAFLRVELFYFINILKIKTLCKWHIDDNEFFSKNT